MQPPFGGGGGGDRLAGRYAGRTKSERVSAFGGVVDSWREKSDDGESSGFGVEFDPPVPGFVPPLWRLEQCSLPCCIVREDRKGGSRASLARPFLSPPSPLLSLSLPIHPCIFIPTLFSYVAALSSLATLLSFRSLDSSSIFPPFYFLLLFFSFFLEKVRDSYFLTLRIFSPPPCARVWRTTARIVVVILFFSFFLGFENGTREMFVSSLRLLAETI